MLYLDPSLLVSFIATEARTERALAWLLGTEDPLITSEWATTEVASALSIKQRRGELDAGSRAYAERQFVRLMDEDIEVKPVLTADFRQAAEFVRAPERKLRGGDALHIAVAGRLGATLHSLDDNQVEAARQLGLDAVVTVEKG